METNFEIQLAWQFIENTGTHLFLTGKAGTGKTTFLRELKAKSPKRSCSTYRDCCYQCRWSDNTLFLPTSFCTLCAGYEIYVGTNFS